MKIYVIVVTFNAEPWIDDCFGCIINSNCPISKTIVVDNGSSDNTIQRLQRDYPSVVIIKAEKNLGFGAANNIGLKMALEDDCDYVYLLNQDAWFEENTLNTLIEANKNNPEFGIISPLQLTTDENLEQSFLYCTESDRCESLHNDAILGKMKEIYPVNYSMAANWLVSRECLKRVGGFSPTFYHYGEDNNYQDRARFHGLKSGICPLARAVHDRGNRPYTKKDYIKFQYLKILYTSSNPTFSTRKKCKKVSKLLLGQFIYAFRIKSFRPIKNIFDFIFMIPTIIKNNKITSLSHPSYLC